MNKMNLLVGIVSIVNDFLLLYIDKKEVICRKLSLQVYIHDGIPFVRILYQKLILRN